MPALAPMLLLAAPLLLVACAQPEERRAFSCPAPDKVASLRNIHYPDLACEDVVSFAEGRLTTAFYRKACQQLAPSAGLPVRVEAAGVTRCDAAASVEGFEGGSVAQIDVCCP